MQRLFLIGILLAVIGQLAVGAARPLLAQQMKAREAVEAAREGLSERGFPWYDAEQDELQRIEVHGDTEAAEHRTSDWLGQQRDWDWNWNFGLPGGLSGILNVVFWGLLLLLLAGLVYLLVRVLLKGEGVWGGRGTSRAVENVEDLVDDRQRVESLPFEIDRPQRNLLDEARRCYEAGDFDRAIIYLYSYQLVYLDRHQIIHLAKGKTNRQYLRELRWRQPLDRLLEITVTAFEDVFFGHYTLDRQHFERCWNELETFHHHVALAAEQATAA